MCRQRGHWLTSATGLLVAFLCAAAAASDQDGSTGSNSQSQKQGQSDERAGRPVPGQFIVVLKTSSDEAAAVADEFMSRRRAWGLDAVHPLSAVGALVMRCAFLPCPLYFWSLLGFACRVT